MAPKRKADKKGSMPQEHGEEEEEALQQAQGAEDDELENQLEAAFQQREAAANVWKTGGPAKDAAIRMLIQAFSSMVESFPKDDAIPDHRGRYRVEDMEFRKLLDASKQVVKAKRVLLKNENFDTREFTIFMAGKKWAKNILAPLLALCEKEDSTLAMNICSFSLVLIKKISDKTKKEVDAAQIRIKKRKTVDDDFTSEWAIVHNFQEQVSALLSFKEALCGEKCNAAIINAFREFWLREKTETENNADSKLGVAICLSFFRRILAISAPPQWCSPSEVLAHRTVHCQYIVQLRVLLSLLPGIISDLQRSYHDDWLADVMLILHYVLMSFDAEDLFLVWKSGGILANFSSLLESDSDPEPHTTPSHNTLSAPPRTTTTTAAVRVPVSLTQRRESAIQSPGLLTSLLHNEKHKRAQQSLSLGSSALRGNRTFSMAVKNVPQPSSIPTFTDFTQDSSVPRPNDALNSQVDALLSQRINLDGTGKDPLGAASSQRSLKDPLHVQTTGTLATQSALLLKNPFAAHSESLPQAKTKRNRRNVAFRTDASLPEDHSSSLSLSSLSQSPASQQACVVAASLCECLTEAVCLKALVRRVNEDLRRDELRINAELETQYFQSLAKLLQFNRLKLEEQRNAITHTDTHRDVIQDNKTEKLHDITLDWRPDLLNVIDALDRMSFSRVVFSLERLSKSDALSLSSQAIHPLTLYTEMLHYLRLLCESSVLGHHELAVGVLYRLFYVGQAERLDPLPKVLALWQSGECSKAYTVQLMECVQATWRTLETARERFRERERVENNRGGEESVVGKKKEKGGKKELDLEHYLVSALRFEVEEYVKKVCSPHTVSMYVRVVSSLRENTQRVNELVTAFFQRICALRIESDDMFASQSALFSGTERERVKPHLGHLLFSLPTLIVFHSLLTDEDNRRARESNKTLISLITEIVRQFGEISGKNRMMAVEILFTHARPHDTILQWNSVYDSNSYALTRWANEHHTPHNALSQDESESEKERESEEEEGLHNTDQDEEFDDVKVDAILRERAAQRERERESEREKTKRERQRERQRTKRQRERERDSESDEDRVSSKIATKKGLSGTSSRRSAWREEEDNELRRLYAMYAGSRSVFTTIAQSDEMRSFGRSAQQVEKRVTELQLHLSLSDTERDTHTLTETHTVLQRVDEENALSRILSPAVAVPVKEKKRKLIKRTRALSESDRESESERLTESQRESERETAPQVSLSMSQRVLLNLDSDEEL